MNLQILCDEAVALLRKGRGAEAERLCSQILAAAPANAAASHLLATIRYQQGRNAEAQQLVRVALKVNPGAPGPLVLNGLLLQQAGRRDEALACYDRVLAAAPKLIEAHNNRGNVLCEMGRFADALASFDRALALKPDFALALYNRGLALRGLGRNEDALASFARALAADPNYVDALNGRGGLLRDMNRAQEALADFDRALARDSSSLPAWYNRGLSLQDLGRFEDAVASYEGALALHPGFAAAHINRGAVLHRLGRFEDALASFTRALAIEPQDAATLNNRAETLRALGRLEEALADAERALAINPDYAVALADRGETLRSLGRLQEALASYDRALVVEPGNAAAYNNRGNILRELRRFDEAWASYDRAIALKPDFTDALFNRGNLAWVQYRDLDSALADMEKVLALDPDFPYAAGEVLHLRSHAGNWSDFARRAALVDAGVRAGKRIIGPFAYQAISASPADLQACSVLYAGHRFPPVSMSRPPRRDGAMIRIGYVSGEFREQATAILGAGLYELHDKARFEIIAFDNGHDDASPMRRRLEAAFDRFVDISALPDAAAAEAIAAEGIDILVNLNGYFGAHRAGVFARRPAPIQVNYLGFPATLGAHYIDYILADRCVIPESDRQHYTEKVVWLPDTYQVNDCRRVIAENVPTRAASGLPETGFVFCNFNQSYKLAPATFASWMRLLREVPDSVLWLLQSNARFVENLRRAAAAEGVAPDRLVFAPTLDPEEHLARLGLADLFLDSLPYNAHTTASDALWAGLPLVTCRGTAFAGRVAASLLHAVGLPELVTETMQDYEALILELARDPARLRAVREKLVANRLAMPLFDTDRFRRHIESAYATMWEIFRRGEGPRSFAVEPAPERPSRFV